MSDFSDNFGPAAAELLNLRGEPIEYQTGAPSEQWTSITANVGPEDTRIVEKSSNQRDLMRVRSIEFSTNEFEDVTPERSRFRISDEVWTVNLITARGPTLTIVEVVRSPRVERAGRAQTSR